MKEYDGKKFKDCTKEKLELPENVQEEDKDLCEYIKEVLGEKIEKV